MFHCIFCKNELKNDGLTTWYCVNCLNGRAKWQQKSKAECLWDSKYRIGTYRDATATDTTKIIKIASEVILLDRLGITQQHWKHKCMRLTQLIRPFNEKITDGVYNIIRVIPPIEDLDLSTLTNDAIETLLLFI